MRLLYLCHQDNYHIRKWVPALRRTGIDVQCATLRPSLPFEDGSACFDLSGGQPAQYRSFFTCVPALRSLIRKLRPDLMLASSAPGYGVSALLSGFRPYVVQTWSRDAELPGSLITLTDHLSVKGPGRMALRHAAGITTDGRYCRDVLAGVLPRLAGKMHPTAWGIDLDFFQPEKARPGNVHAQFNLRPGRPLVVFPRGLFWYYQPGLVLTALNRVATVRPDTDFLVLTAGQPVDKRFEPDLRALAEKPNIRLYTGFAGRDLMRDILACARFTVSVPRFDGVSEVLTEARAMGSIPVCNRVGSNLERIIEGQHGFFVEDSTPAQLAQALIQVLDQPESLLQAIRNENARWVRAFGSVDQTAASLAAFLRRIAD